MNDRAAERRRRHLLAPELRSYAEQGWMLRALGALAGLLLLAVVQGQGTQRSIVVVLLAGAVLLLGVRTDAGARLALLLMPFLGLLRRVTGGPDAYVLNDPFVLLPTALMVPAVLLLPRRLLRPPARLWIVLAGWLVLGEGLGVVQGLSIPTAVYGAATAVVPLLLGAKIAIGSFAGLPRFLIRLLPPAGAAVGLYGVYQWVSPPDWDLAWLRTQQAALTSVGFPEAGQFRIWATTESPGIAALLLGAAASVALPLAIRRSTPLLERVGLLAALVPILFCLVLTEARTGLFAVPLAVGATVLLDRDVRKLFVLPALAVLVLVAVVVPPLLSSSSTEQARYDVAALSQDKSFQDRQQLLPQFRDTLVSRPLGTGSGSTQLGARLAGGGTTVGGGNIDNGYLTRLIETGVPGFVLFVAVVLRTAAAFRRRRRSGAPTAVEIGCIGIIVFYLLTDASGPSTNGSIAILFWICLGHLASLTATTRTASSKTGPLVVEQRADSRVARGPGPKGAPADPMGQDGGTSNAEPRAVGSRSTGSSS